jgi:S-DNA-T family DNA segregation ATPase FtsK/SpoIIIE
MLFLPPEASAPIRAQGVMVSDDEIQRVISFWHKQLPPETRTSSPWDSLVLEQEQTPADQLLEQAIEIVRKAQRANASLLQRRLRIGYPRAARLLDELEEKGIIGPADQALRGDREVYLPPEDDAAE